MSMKSMYELRDMLCDELDKIAAKRDMNPGDLEKMAGYHLEFMPSVSEFLDILFNYIQRSRLSRKN